MTAYLARRKLEELEEERRFLGWLNEMQTDDAKLELLWRHKGTGAMRGFYILNYQELKRQLTISLGVENL